MTRPAFASVLDVRLINLLGTTIQHSREDL
jgi:hypothetical protein